MKTFTEPELTAIYSQIVKKNENYFNQYNSIPMLSGSKLEL